MGEYSDDEVDRARASYEAYGAQSGGVSLVSGARLPAWDSVPTTIKQAWVAAANAASAHGNDDEDEFDSVGDELPDGYDEMSSTELKSAAASRGLAQGGSKADLTERLRAHDTEQTGG